ncbi:hypothetical protein ElyMa_004504000 [Elysia marginata]|uniref:Uncharacterized protein n=1 Tax=Elysia marginata TaxID=1093978 RepID=A0AAV4HKW9_9GAST|nr:hypothetical protein ElyMa_004504000 [Elysia marginata]
MSFRQTRKSPLSSKKLLELNGENAREERELEKELSRLEKERLIKIRELRQEMQNFRISSARSKSGSRSPSMSPSSRSPSRRSISPYSSPPRNSPRNFGEYQFITQTSNNTHQSNVPQTSSSRPSSGREAPLLCLNRSISHDAARDGGSAKTRLPAINGRSSDRGSRSPSPRLSVSDFDSLTCRYTQDLPPRYTLTSSNSYNRAISLDGCVNSSGLPTPPSLSPNASASSSPQTSPRLLSKRHSTAETAAVGRAASPRMNTTSTTVSVLHMDGKNIHAGPRLSIFDMNDGDVPNFKKSASDVSKTSAIPQIVISSHAPNPAAPPPPPNTVRSVHHNEDPRPSSDSGISCDATRSSTSVAHAMTASLEVPLRRGRSRSVPTIPEECTTYLRALAKKESSFETADIAEDLSFTAQTSEPMRARSSSICVPYFSHLKDAPRRDSLLHKYTARRGSFRRTSCTIERLISDLARGVHHEELTSDYSGRTVSVTPEEWEKLRQCRYLRMPNNKDGRGEQRTLDIDEIFSHKIK